MKRVLILIGCLLSLSLYCAVSLADPLPLLEDYAENIVFPYDEENPDGGVFVYSFRYPHPDETAPGGSGINVFYQDLIDYTLNFTVPLFQDAFEGADSSTVVTYSVTCNNDDFFSVLIRTDRSNPDQSLTLWEGHVFSRAHGSAGYTYTLPKLLGLLSPDDNEEWLQDFQTEKTDQLIRDMVWDLIEENADDINYGNLTRESLSAVFFPEESFYLDENGDPVFYLQPGDVYESVPEGAALLTFPLSLEDIRDEL